MTLHFTHWRSGDNQCGSSVPVVSRWLWPGNRTFLEVASMVVTWGIVDFCTVQSDYTPLLLTLKVLNFWKFTSYCSLKPLWSGMGKVVPARTSPTLHPPSPPTVHQLLWLALKELKWCASWLHSLMLLPEFLFVFVSSNQFSTLLSICCCLLVL